MLTFEPIHNPDHSAFVYIKPLYENAFPLSERRTWPALLHLLSEPQMQLNAIHVQTFAGFVIYWQLENCLYIEHFAIDPAMRGKNYGTTVIEHLKTLSGQKLLLEIELPESEGAIRRMRFYEKLGLKPLPFNYSQPPYRKGGTPFPMILMSTDALVREEYELIAADIRQQVYERFY